MTTQDKQEIEKIYNEYIETFSAIRTLTSFLKKQEIENINDLTIPEIQDILLGDATDKLGDVMTITLYDEQK